MKEDGRELEAIENNEHEKRRGALLAFIFFIFVLIILNVYLFLPTSVTEFSSKNLPSDFNIGNISNEMQFYPNMRYPSDKITYNIKNSCNIQKKDHMRRAFDMLENVTVLKFFPVSKGEDILVECEDKDKTDGRMFVAGEGGPINITKSGEFYIIKRGKILLIRNPKCPNPNVGLHELLHALGFTHSSNPKNIMYNVTSCNQEIGNDLIETIEKLYSVKPLPDLALKNVSATMHGRYLDIKFIIQNEGISSASESKVVIYGKNNKTIREVSIQNLEPGNGRKISITNIWNPQFGIDSYLFKIEYPFKELNKKNNVVELVSKKE